MIDLIKQLNSQFCVELNASWKKAIEASNGKEFNLSIFGELKSLIFEARDQGYNFNVDYLPDLFIQEQIMGKDLETEFCTLPEWNEVIIINRMIKESKQNNWDFILPHFEELQKQHLRPVMLQYAIKCVKIHGPFFAGPQNDTINVFGFTGSIAEECTLLSMIYGRR